MMAQHTPGPWRVGIDKITVYRVAGPETVIAVMKEGRRQDNARLIAQAPAMLKLLHQLSRLSPAAGIQALCDAARAILHAVDGESTS